MLCFDHNTYKSYVCFGNYVSCVLQGYAAREFISLGLLPGELAIISKEAVSLMNFVDIAIFKPWNQGVTLLFRTFINLHFFRLPPMKDLP